MLRIGGELPLDLVAQRLAVWPRYLVAAPEYLRRKGRPRQPKDLSRHDYVRYAGRDDTVELNGPRGSLSLSMTSRYRVNSAVAMLEAVRDGAGIAFQPSWMVNELLAQGALVRVLAQWAGPAQTAHLVYPPRRRQPMRVQAMLEFLLATVPRF